MLKLHELLDGIYNMYEGARYQPPHYAHAPTPEMVKVEEEYRKQCETAYIEMAAKIKVLSDILQTALKPEDRMVLVNKDKLEGLENRDEFLSCLEGAGVDNWDGYSFAQEEYKPIHEE